MKIIEGKVTSRCRAHHSAFGPNGLEAKGTSQHNLFIIQVPKTKEILAEIAVSSSVAQIYVYESALPYMKVYLNPKN